jgi:hypothetical protein
MSTDAGLVQVWQQHDGHWRWAWRRGADDEQPLVSYRAFDSEEEARASARECYPDLFAGAARDGNPLGPLLRGASVALVVAATIGRARNRR